MNSKYITNTDDEKLYELLKPFYREAGIDIEKFEKDKIFKMIFRLKRKRDT